MKSEGRCLACVSPSHTLHRDDTKLRKIPGILCPLHKKMCSPLAVGDLLILCRGYTHAFSYIISGAVLHLRNQEEDQ